jgi:hypothetical protein
MIAKSPRPRLALNVQFRDRPIGDLAAEMGRVQSNLSGWEADWRLWMDNAEWLALTLRRGDPGRDNWTTRRLRRFANVR